MEKKICAKKLGDLCESILRKYEISEKSASDTVKSLIDADLLGINSHGIIRLPLYLQNLKEGYITKEPIINEVKTSFNAAVLDGGNGLGQVVSQHAVDRIIEETKEKDIYAISVRNSNHFGTARYWADQLQEHGLIGIVTSNVPPIMPPTGGAEARVGNNPLSIAIPAGESQPIILDMATSNVPFGRILDFQSKGKEIPKGWAVNAAGEHTTDPDEVVKGGYLFPVGGPKGYGLSVIIEALTSLLSNGAVGNDIRIHHNTPNNVSHFFMGIRIDAFMGLDQFKRQVDYYVQFIKNTKRIEGVDEIFLPGEMEVNKQKVNEKDGLAIPNSLLTQLVALAEEAKVDEVYLRSFYDVVTEG
ncbi:Ldh family oxidoreductase [Siminovitchia acidinfaciens]|uniref:Ldh family oxidoreductase n=1 Tax=Siminovitchia acidinfaciens TaxID=2321395 RepID=A0A429Y6Q1_9BACI|nr:Ldh family oxidoreductase [Siminovitchia acidinfaciens]RST77137.1 Ldh family oxidoreductase [Siminovitchia acidinfaciens]